MQFPPQILKDAFNACDPARSLGVADSRYVDLAAGRGDEGDVVEQCRKLVLRSESPQVQLFVGHRGSGKSSELRRLQMCLEADGYFVVFLSDLDLEDTEPVDVPVIRALKKELREGGFRSSPLNRDRLLGREARAVVQKAGHKDLVLLTRFGCHTIVTAQIALISQEIVRVKALFPHWHILPMVKIFSRESREPWSPGRRLLEEILRRRFDVDGLLEEGVVETLVEMSGGHPRLLMNLMQDSLAMVEVPPVTVAAARKAVRRLMNDYDRSIPERCWPILARIHQEHKVLNDEDHQLMLLNLMVLEYQNGERWSDVQPVILSLPRFQEELQRTQQADLQRSQPTLLEESAKAYHLRRLQLKDIRGFSVLNIDLSAPLHKKTIIIGRNGTGKTTLLRCVALALAGDKDAPALLSSPKGRWITNGEGQGGIQLHLESVDGKRRIVRKLEIAADNGDELVRSEESVSEKIFVCAYGMGRGDFGGELGRDYRVMDSVATLFDYGERLVSSELVLRRLHDFLGSQRFDVVLAGLKRALGLSPDHRIELPAGGGVEVSGPDLGGRIPLEGWADGYRMTFSWLIDFYGWAMRAGAFDEDGDVCGILLIDEIEQHLHPAMQREILGHLEKVLPKIQIIATTHSPLVALSARPEEIVALHRDGDRVYGVRVPSLNGYSVEDVLVEEALFGTNPYAPATEAQLSRYQELAQIPPEQRSSEQADELRELASRLDPSSIPALRDDPVLAKLDDIAALLNRQGQEPSLSA